jgi:hypothetical protein
LTNIEPKLLSREAFREQVFARDGNTCVFCGAPAEDAHHILERKLWPDGGYYLDNGASVCGPHHMACETTELSVEAVRKACGIKTALLPPQLAADETYDKWGNVVLANGQRLKGPLFHDVGAQRMLKERLTDFTSWVKYPRTYHLPWSPGLGADDRVIPSLTELEGEVVMTEKFDGENTTLYADHLHARSLDSKHHVSRDWVKAFWSSIRHDIPPGWRVCGENLYARHSVSYDALASYFLGFSVWNDRNEALAWDETLEWFELLGITPVRVLYEGPFDQKALAAAWTGEGEGYVVRTHAAIPYARFQTRIAKFVRKNHVQTDTHWMHGAVTPNRLKT